MQPVERSARWNCVSRYRVILGEAMPKQVDAPIASRDRSLCNSDDPYASPTAKARITATGMRARQRWRTRRRMLHHAAKERSPNDKAQQTHPNEQLRVYSKGRGGWDPLQRDLRRRLPTQT